MESLGTDKYVNKIYRKKLSKIQKKQKYSQGEIFEMPQAVYNT